MADLPFIKNVSHAPCEWADWMTEWTFDFDPSATDMIRERLISELHHLGSIWRDELKCMMIPAQGEWDEDLDCGWCYMAGFEELPLSVDCKKHEFTITIYNKPEGDDALDPMHEHFTSPNPHQWIEALAAVREIFK